MHGWLVYVTGPLAAMRLDALAGPFGDGADGLVGEVRL